MANSRHSSQNPFPRVGTPDGSRQAGTDAGFTRPFELHEALPYTSFTSIVPFDSSILPVPSIGSASPAPSLHDLTPSNQFDSLNQEVLAGGPTSKLVQQSLSQIQRLLERGSTTEYKFKTGPNRAAGVSVQNPSAAAVPSLTPFSTLVYEQAAIPFRYPTPDTPSSISPNGQPAAPVRAPAKQASPTAQKAPPLKQAINAQKNKQAHGQNFARLEIVLPTKSQLEQAASVSKPSGGVKSSPSAGAGADARANTPQSARPAPTPQPDAIEDSITVTPVKSTPPVSSGSHQRSVIAVELPQAPFDKTQFLVLPDEPDEPATLSMRKGTGQGFDGDGIYAESLDLRQRADVAFNELRQVLQQVFEAEKVALRTQASNDIITLISQDEATLTSTAQSRVQALLERTISLNCFQIAPLDDLLRLFRLCEVALRQAGSMDIKIEESWNVADVDQWVQQLPSLEVAIKAARTSLRMMCGGRQDKQLYSEDVINQSLELFKHVMDGIIIPVAELRTADSTAELFRALGSHKKKIVSFFNECQKLFSLMSTLISKIDTSEVVSTQLEYMASKLVFIETAHAERESVIDTQKFDGLRLVAMTMLSQIFLLNQEQRRGIFDEILTSLEKLPTGKRARTFKLVDGGSIQPVSALIMRLVQTSAGQVNGSEEKAALDGLPSTDENGNEQPTSRKAVTYSIRDEDHGALEHTTAIDELSGLVDKLLRTALANALYVVNFIVQRALKSTKTGESPYRVLLDLFVEDFTSCLDNPDWPGAELLLRLLTSKMFQLMEDKTSSVTAKNLALELLGLIGAAITKLRGHVRKAASALEGRDTDDLARFLCDLASATLDQNHRPEKMVAWTGPYRATLEYLESRFGEDQHLSSAITYIISEWGNKVCTEYESFSETSQEQLQEFGRLAYRLREMIQDRRWLSNEFTFKDVSSNQARLSYSITLAGSQLCGSLRKIMRILLSSTTSDQPTMRSKSLKSVNHVLETDPSILDDGEVVNQIVQCTNDSSTQVRDSALGLIGNCISMRPALESSMVGIVIERFIDTGPGVRKRAMKLARDIYLRNNNKAIRSAIANGILHRVQDHEESVRDLARQVIEEIWFLPFYGGENSAATQISIADHVNLMVQTVKQGNASNVFDKVLQTLFAPESKTAQASLGVCTKLVASMFDLVDNPNSDDPSVPSGRDALQVLQIFAKAEPSLFTFEQLRLLLPYVESMKTMKTNEDGAIARAVVVIYKRVLPQLSTAHSQFLQSVRGDLLPTITKAPRALVDDTIACVWIISTLLVNSNTDPRVTPTVPVMAVARSSLLGIKKLYTASQQKPLLEQQVRQFERYSLIVGMLAKHCNLDSHLADFKEKFPTWKGTNVAELMVEVVLPFAQPAQPLEVRKAALDSIGLICQAWPRNYDSPKVYTIFQQVFNSEIAALESMVLRSFKEFLLVEEQRSEQATEAPTINGTKAEKKRELTVMGGTSYDDVASSTAQRFLGPIIRIAKSTQDEHAFLAVEVLASINRQGLTHPKETGVTFITLETSSNPRISELAFAQHKALHAKHETVIEREYVNALKAVFTYQRDVVKDPRGATIDPFTPKLQLMMEVLKMSKSKNRQRFLDKICNQVDFDLLKLEKREDRNQHVQYSSFLVENIAFFEYLTVGEVHSIVATIEKLVSSTGATVAQAVESEVLHFRMDALDSTSTPNPNPTAGDVQMEVQPEPSRPEINLSRLEQLTAASMILLSLWEVRTHLRRLYGMGTGRRDTKGKTQSKDLSKTPIKVPSVTGAKVWEELTTISTSLTCRERMMETCRAFVDLMSVDKEFMIQDEDDEMNSDEPTTPGNEDDDDDNERPSAGRGRKRKAGGPAPGGKKKRARSTSQPRKRGRPRKSIEAADGDGDGEDGEWF